MTTLTYKQTQIAFAELLARLVLHCRAIENGCYALRLDWGYRDAEAQARVGKSSRSQHPEHMAQDTTLYFRDSETEDWTLPMPTDVPRVYGALHDWWEANGGALRISNDLNHFSLGWGGVR